MVYIQIETWCTVHATLKCSTLLYNIKVLCLRTSFVYQVRLNEAQLDCRLRLCVLRLVSGAISTVVTWSKYLNDALQVLSTTVHDVRATWFPGLFTPVSSYCCIVCVGLWFVANIPSFHVAVTSAWHLDNTVVWSVVRRWSPFRIVSVALKRGLRALLLAYMRAWGLVRGETSV